MPILNKYPLVISLVIFFASYVVIVWSLGEFYSVDGKNALFAIYQSSESLMQTLPLELLDAEPINAIFYLHIQPPVLDTIRAICTVFWSTGKGELTEFVDNRMVFIWIICSALLSTLIYGWIRKVTGARIYPILVGLVWVLHPSSLSMVTNLDSTLISTLFITWLIFEMWLLANGSGSVVRIVIAASMCFLTRTLFQWYFLPVFLIAIVLSGSLNKKTIGAILALAIVMIIFCMKQYLLFGTVSTTTFSGEHKSGLLWIQEANPSGGDIWKGEFDNNVYRKFVDDHKQFISLHYPEEAKQYSGGYNTEKQWVLNQVHNFVAAEKCASDPGSCITSVVRSVKQNWPEYWIETWDGRNKLVKQLHWEELSGRLVYKYQLAALICIGIFLFMNFGKPHIGWWRVFGITAIPGYILLICLLGNRYDWYEGGRLKYFLEPSLYVFLTVQFYNLMKRLKLFSRNISTN